MGGGYIYYRSRLSHPVLGEPSPPRIARHSRVPFDHLGAAPTLLHSSRICGGMGIGYAYLFKYIIIGDSAVGKSCRATST